MPTDLVGIGLGNVVAAEQIVCVIRADSKPVRRLVEKADSESRLVDATGGRRTRSVIITRSNHIILSHVHSRTIATKLAGVPIAEPSDEAGG